MLLVRGLHVVGGGSGELEPTGPFDSHVYLLDGGSEAALVDAGVGAATDTLLANVRRAGVELDRLRVLLLTHAHPDHAGGAAALSERLAHPAVLASPLAARWLRDADEEAIGVEAGRRADFYPADFRLVACDAGEVRDGDRMRVGSVEVEVVVTPGHADGHVCFLATISGRRSLFAGDLLFAGGLVSLANRPDCRIPDYAASVAKLAEARVELLLPGHHAVALRDGQRHVDTAHRIFSAGLVPRSIV